MDDKKSLFEIWSNLLLCIEKNGINVDNYKSEASFKKNVENVLVIEFNDKKSLLYAKIDLDEFTKNVNLITSNIANLPKNKYLNYYLILVTANSKNKNLKHNKIQFRKFMFEDKDGTHSRLNANNTFISIFHINDFALNIFNHTLIPPLIRVIDTETVRSILPKDVLYDKLPIISNTDPIVKRLFLAKINDVIEARQIRDYNHEIQFRIIKDISDVQKDK